VGNLTLSIDGKSYPIYNWHPLNDDAQLTTVGVVIPYIAVSLSSGVHDIVLIGSSQFITRSVPYFIESAYGVYS
jgi:hypothetical protein